jgi:hypothetical protein
VRTAAAGAHDLRHGIGRTGVHGHVGTERAGQGQLFFADVERGHVQAHRLGVLHGQMTETADAGNRDPFAGSRLGFADALVGGDAGAEDRRQRGEIAALRQAGHVGRSADRVFGERPVHAVAAVVLALAERLPAGRAVFAAAAGVVQPGDADRVAFLEPAYTGTERGDDAGALVSGDESRRRFHRPIAVRGVQVGVADAGGDDLHEHLAGAWRGYRDLFDRQRLAERMHDRRAHHLRHGHSPSSWKRPTLASPD